MFPSNNKLEERLWTFNHLDTTSPHTMSVFAKEAFQMSALPSPAESRARSPVPAGAVTPAMEPSENPHIAEIDVESVLFDVSAAKLYPWTNGLTVSTQMDGTLINSSPAVVKAWNLFAQTYPLDLEDILRCEFLQSPGIRMLTSALSCPRYAND